MPVHVRVPAKINLNLTVGEVRSDGYHQVDTVYGAVSLFDELEAAHAGEITLTVTGPESTGVPDDDGNLVIAAAHALAAHAGVKPLVRFTLHKRIPVAAGMAGGSADAAAALLACDALWGLDTPPAVLAAIAVQLGSDVPYCLHGGVARGVGTGTDVAHLHCHFSRSLWWVVSSVDGGLSAREVYAELDRLRAGRLKTQGSRVSYFRGIYGGVTPRKYDTREEGVSSALVPALARGDIGEVARCVRNDLQQAVLSLRPELADLLAAGSSAGALASVVTGSGPTCVFLAADQQAAEGIRTAVDAHPVSARSHVVRMPEVPLLLHSPPQR